MWFYGHAMPERHTVPPLRRLADLHLGGKLDEFVQTRRVEGRSWRLIERDLYLETDGLVEVAFETLRNWYAGAAA